MTLLANFIRPQSLSFEVLYRDRTLNMASRAGNSHPGIRLFLQPLAPVVQTVVVTDTIRPRGFAVAFPPFTDHQVS